jgi:hypothetical protein
MEARWAQHDAYIAESEAITDRLADLIILMSRNEVERKEMIKDTCSLLKITVREKMAERSSMPKDAN